MKKKAQAISLANSPSIVILLGFTVLLAAAIAISIQGLRDTSSLTGRSTEIEDNESFTAFNDTAIDVTTTEQNRLFYGDSKIKFIAGSCRSVDIWNISDANVTGLFTISGCTVTLDADEGAMNGTSMTANYTYDFNTYQYGYNITDRGLLAVFNISDQFPTIGTILGVALVIVVIVGSFAFLFLRGGAL